MATANGSKTLNPKKIKILILLFLRSGESAGQIVIED